MTERESPCITLLQVQKQVERQADQIHKNDLVCAEIKIELSNIKDDTSEIKGDIKVIKEKPGKKYDGIITNVSNWLIILILAYIASAIGLYGQ